MHQPTIHLDRRAILGLAGATTLWSLAGCLGRGFAGGDDVTETVERRFPGGDVAELHVSNLVGDVLVAADDSDAVDVRVRKRAGTQAGLDAVDVRTSLEGGVLRVETELTDRRFRNRESPVTEVTVTVPEGDAGPVVGSVVSDIGDVGLLDTRGDTVVRTDLGDVTASGVDGYLSLESELGSVEAADVAGLDRVFTELGDVKVDLLGVRRDLDVGTQLGSVAVGVAADLDLAVLAESQGAVSSDLPLAGLESTARRVAGRLNAGGHRVHVSSQLGDVALRTIPGRE